MTPKYVVVTGAAKGIGQATALHLDKLGFTVFAGVRNEADGEILRQKTAGRIIPLILDVTRAEQIEQAAQTVGQKVGTAGLAGLVNNAGVAVAAPLEFVPVEELRHQLEVNLVGQVAVTQAFLPFLRSAKGRIINISSVGGRIAGPMLGPYHASKFGLEAISDTLRVELRPWGIEVVTIEPGTIATPIWETSQTAVDKIVAKLPPQLNELYGKAIAKTRATASSANQKGLPPERVAEKVGRALTAPRPKTRYQVGTDSIIGVNLISRLPDRWRDRLIANM